MKLLSLPEAERSMDIDIKLTSVRASRYRLFGSPEGERIVRDDIARFIGHTFAYFVGEHVQKI